MSERIKEYAELAGKEYEAREAVCREIRKALETLGIEVSRVTLHAEKLYVTGSLRSSPQERSEDHAE